MDGFLIINKPKWYTSFDVVACCRKKLDMKKIGHTGTLDPMATGVMLVCVGKATSLVEEISFDEKIYRTTLQLGVKTDSADITGSIVEYYKDGKLNNNDSLKELYNNIDFKYINEFAKARSERNIDFINNSLLTNNFNLSEEKVAGTLKNFVGEQLQSPPLYSSIKVNGRKLYEYARKGIEVDIPKRPIYIFDIYDISFNGKDKISYTVYCSKGTYIRSLNEDIAKALGTVGTTLELQRIKTGSYELKSAINIEEISEDKIISIENLYKEKIELDEEKAELLLNGGRIKVSYNTGVYNIYKNGKYLGLGRVENSLLKRYIIL